MKIKHRILSLLLALALVIGIVPTYIPSVAEAAMADTPAGVRNHLPSTAKDIVYLSDMNWEYSINYQDGEAKKDYPWNNANAKMVLGAAESNGGTVFTKGLGVMPIGTESDPNAASRTIFDLADNNYAQDFFYAAVGLTNRNADTTNADNGVVFQVWASYDKTVEDYTQAEYTLLESSGTVQKGYVYHFHLDVSDVRYLKLVVYAVNGISAMNSLWANACVYNNTGYYPKAALMGLNNGADNSTYVPSTLTDRFHTYNFENIPEGAVYLSGSVYKNASDNKKTDKVVEFQSASGNLGAPKQWLGGENINADGAIDSSQKDGILMTNGAEFLRFNARQPKNSNNVTDGWVTFDISDLNVNWFYTVVGVGNNSAKINAYAPDTGMYGGMKTEVWGAKEADGEYTLLAASEPFMLSNSGEFLVNIAGYNYLKLRVQAQDTRLINGLDVIFYKPVVYCEGSYITVDGETNAVQGTEVTYTPTVVTEGEVVSNYAGTITWAVSGNEKTGTKIENGKLTIDPYETATELTVSASITEGGETVTYPVTVSVSASPAYTLEIQGPTEAIKGSEHDITGIVTMNGAPVAYDNIAWELTGNADTATKLENGKLTIGNETVGTELTIKASYTEYGILHEDTLKVTIIAYEIMINGYSEMLTGGEMTLEADILNEGNSIAGTVTWSVDGIGTIQTDGNKVIVTAMDTVGTIKVTAKWTSPAGTEITKTHEIVVSAYTIDLNGAASAVTKGEDMILSAVVKQGAAVDADASISWKVVDLQNNNVVTATGATLTLSTANYEVGTPLLITASVEIGGVTLSDTYAVTVTDYKLVVAPSATEVMQGNVAELVATLSKGETAVENPVISWNVTKADGSSLNINGTSLKLTANEEVGTVLTVVATAVVDGETVVSAPVTVTVTAAPAYVVTITDSVASMVQGESASFAASVTKDGVADTEANLIWFLTGQTAVGTAIDSNGKLVVDEAEPLGTELKVAAAIVVDGKLIVTEAVSVVVTMDAYTPYEGGGYMAVPGGATYLSAELEVESQCLGNAPARYDEQWTSGSFKEIWLGGATGGTVNQDGGVRFYKGIAMQPFNPDATHPYGEVYAIYDLSELDIDTFYAVVGLTNQNGQNMDETAAGAYGGIYYEVWATYEENGEYKLIAKSDLIAKTATGEFTVNVEGVQLLKLVVKCKNNVNSAHASMSGMWANACVYSTKVDSYVVTATGTANELKQGEELTFTASATKNGEAMTDAVITWAVTGGTKTGTKIDANGKLTVDAAEAAGTKLSITASITVGETTYTSTPIEVTVKEKPQTAGQTEAYKPSNGAYMALPNGVIYLSDTAWTESKNLADLATIKDGTYKNGDPIWLGGAAGGNVKDDGGTKFDKGLGVMPFNPNDGKNGAAHTIWDVSKLNVNTFYGVVGITNVNGQNYAFGDPYNTSTFTGGGVIFQVYGDYGDGVYKLLAESEVITKTMTGEFKVNIEGVKNLKLVVKCAMDGSGNHSSMNSAWGNACVYASSSTSNDSYTIAATGAATNVQQGKNTQFTAAVTKNGEALTNAPINWAVTGGTKSGTKIDASGKLTIDKKEPAGTKLSVTASITVDGTTYTSTAIVITVDEAPTNYYQKDGYKANTTGKYAELSDKVIYLSDVSWVESVNLKGAISTKNTVWNGTTIYIGGESNSNMTDGTKFEKGIGMQPQEPANGGNAWTTIDVSKLNCDTFYAAIGSTNKANQEFGHNSFIYQVYGATEKDGDFILLAESSPITKTETGEFTVDISDMVLLKLVVKCTDSGTHAYGNSMWANACVYNKDGSAGNPNGGSSNETTGNKPAQENAYTTYSGAYLKPTGTIIYLSDIDWTESNNLSDIETIKDGTYKNGDPIWLGGASGGKVTDGVKFQKGLGVMPFAPNDGKNGAADTIWDVSGLNVNTFYGVVGITNANGQNYAFGDPYNDATFAGGGVIFQVYGDYEGNGEYKLLAESEIITKTLTGEFKVDITGVKLLKLVVKCNLDTGSGHTSMNSAWGNACVFNSETGSLEAGTTTEPTTKPTEPSNATRPATPTKPTTSDDTNDDNSGSNNAPVVIIIVVGVVLLLAIAAVIAIIIRKNKKK